MRNMLLIARREYLERVRSKAFLFMTLFVPVLIIGVTVGPTMLMGRMAGTKRLVVAASDLQTAEMIRRELQNPLQDPGQNDGLGNRNQAVGSKFEVDTDTNVSDAQRAALTEKVKRKQLDGVIWATDETLAANKVPYITRDVSGIVDREIMNQGLSHAMHKRLLQKRGLSDTDIESALKPVDMETVNAMGTGPSNPMTTFVSVMAMVMIMYVSVILYGTNITRSIVEEKTSRVIEVMLSTATANQMMVGKILGVGGVGLTQIGIWTATAALSGGGLGMAVAGMLKGVMTVKLAIFFPVFFLLGFTLYSTLNAAVGAMVNSEQEAQQLQFLVLIPLIASVVVLFEIIQNPSGPLAFWASLFPFTAPLIMFTRIALDQTISSWQVAISIVLLLITTYGLVLLCSRIYRVGILMYGKKPTLPEILKWIKYA
jgi:ABC-2 type transport system permease protein